MDGGAHSVFCPFTRMRLFLLAPILLFPRGLHAINPQIAAPGFFTIFRFPFAQSSPMRTAHG
jgi:hypothetical protein